MCKEGAVMLKGNMLIAHGGGPTPVINSSLLGAVREAKLHGEIETIYGARFGAEGILAGDLIDLGKFADEDLALLAKTPASALGSCRRKLTDADYPAVLECFKKFNIRYFFYNGGNDSMDTCNKIYNLSVETGYELRVIGIPKTIDNDLDVTDHCPGFGSAAKYAAVSALELAQDVSALPIHVVVMEMMGRNAGWITAASALYADLMPCEQLVYLPEVAFDKERFLAAVKEKWAKGRGLLVTISEGIHYADGSPVADSGVVDGFGHKVPGGAAQALSDMIMRETGLKSRSEKPGLLGRVSVALMSEVDQKEAEEAGACAVRSAVAGKTGYMVGFETAREPYASQTILIPLEQVANAEKKFPLEWIGDDGASIRPAFKAYCEPLIGAYDSRFISLR
ncbi:6-phosphofructokinase [Pseudoflavonifractor phocaeensis]|nr:6-phosphofructokinase [Pseudoflavonifractor phocaeensis]